jgi:hypothetical protein
MMLVGLPVIRADAVHAGVLLVLLILVFLMTVSVDQGNPRMTQETMIVFLVEVVVVEVVRHHLRVVHFLLISVQL